MKHKAPLALMEQLIMLLVFALAAALCLQIFVLSDRVSRYCEARDHSVVEVQNAAELMKLHKGDLSRCAMEYGGSLGPETWTIGYDALWQQTDGKDAAYTLQVMLSEQQPLLGAAEIQVREADGDVLMQIAVAWQEDSDG